MSSIITLFIVLCLVIITRRNRSGRISKTKETLQQGGPALSPGRKLARQMEEMRNNGQSGFAEEYREDPAQVAGMKGRSSTVPASGRSSILEADDELDSMLAGRKRKTPGKDSTEGISMLDAFFSGAGSRQNGLKDKSQFAGFEDRQNDWLARQLREEQAAKRRVMSDMMSLKIEHEKDHRRINKIIGK